MRWKPDQGKFDQQGISRKRSIIEAQKNKPKEMLHCALIMASRLCSGDSACSVSGDGHDCTACCK